MEKRREKRSNGVNEETRRKPKSKWVWGRGKIGRGRKKERKHKLVKD